MDRAETSLSHLTKRPFSLQLTFRASRAACGYIRLLDAHSAATRSSVSLPCSKGDRRSDSQLLPPFQPPASICGNSIQLQHRQGNRRLPWIVSARVFAGDDAPINHNTPTLLITFHLPISIKVPTSPPATKEVPMRELTEIPLSELTDTELDAVSGGFFDFGNSVAQINTGVQVAWFGRWHRPTSRSVKHQRYLNHGCPHTPQPLSAGGCAGTIQWRILIVAAWSFLLMSNPRSRP